MKTFNLHALRIFASVAKYGSITMAADRLFISQPAVTKQLRNLEEELGVRLVETKGRGIALTEAGHEIAQMALRIDGIHTELAQYSERYKEGRVGTVRLSATYLPANYILPERIAQYKQHHPDVQMLCTTTNAERAFEMLLEYEVDVAIIGGSTAEPDGLERVEMLRDQVTFVVPRDHRLANQSVSLKEILMESFVVREAGSSMRKMLFALCRVHGCNPPKLGIQTGGMQETIRTIAAGYGAGLVSAIEVQSAVERGEVAIVHVKEADALYNLISIYKREGQNLPPAAALFYQDVLRSK